MEDNCLRIADCRRRSPNKNRRRVKSLGRRTCQSNKGSRPKGTGSLCERQSRDPTKHKKTTIAETPAQPAGVEVAAPVAGLTHEEIARLAYSCWEAHGYQGGSPGEDWLRAVNELRGR